MDKVSSVNYFSSLKSGSIDKKKERILDHVKKLAIDLHQLAQENLNLKGQKQVAQNLYTLKGIVSEFRKENLSDRQEMQRKGVQKLWKKCQHAFKESAKVCRDNNTPIEKRKEVVTKHVKAAKNFITSAQSYLTQFQANTKANQLDELISLIQEDFNHQAQQIDGSEEINFTAMNQEILAIQKNLQKLKNPGALAQIFRSVLTSIKKAVRFVAYKLERDMHPSQKVMQLLNSVNVCLKKLEQNNFQYLKYAKKISKQLENMQHLPFGDILAKHKAILDEVIDRTSFYKDQALFTQLFQKLDILLQGSNPGLKEVVFTRKYLPEIQKAFERKVLHPAVQETLVGYKHRIQDAIEETQEQAIQRQELFDLLVKIYGNEEMAAKMLVKLRLNHFPPTMTSKKIEIIKDRFFNFQDHIDSISTKKAFFLRLLDLKENPSKRKALQQAQKEDEKLYSIVQQKLEKFKALENNIVLLKEEKTRIASHLEKMKKEFDQLKLKFKKPEGVITENESLALADIAEKVFDLRKQDHNKLSEVKTNLTQAEESLKEYRIELARANTNIDLLKKAALQLQERMQNRSRKLEFLEPALG